MQLPIALVRDGATPLQDQIAGRVRELVLQRRLVAGLKMPSSRDLSVQLDVSRNTVIGAYDKLLAEGYLAVRGRLGLFICAQIPEHALDIPVGPVGEMRLTPAPSNKILPLRHRSPLLYQRRKERVELDFRIGRPAASSFPERLWTRLIVEKMGGGGRRLTEYGDPAGLWELRSAIANHLKSARGITAQPTQIVIVGGCEEGLNIVAKALVPAGSSVYVENPCYKGVQYVFESYGAAIVPIPVDDEGICVDALSGREAGLVCVTPSHQFPMGVTMSLSRRLKLLEWVNRVGGYVVEDDYDSDFRYDGSPLTALAGLDATGSVIYVGTFSKSIGAGLRVGYVVAPSELVGPIREAKALLNNGNPWLEQAVLAEFLSSGGFRRHLRRIRQMYLGRRDTLIEHLRRRFGDVTITGEGGGMHLTWMLPEGIPNARALQYECLHLGVGIYSIDDSPAIHHGEHPARERAVFFGYPCLEEAQIVEAVERIAIAAQRLGA